MTVEATFQHFLEKLKTITRRITGTWRNQKTCPLDSIIKNKEQFNCRQQIVNPIKFTKNS